MEIIPRRSLTKRQPKGFDYYWKIEEIPTCFVLSLLCLRRYCLGTNFEFPMEKFVSWKIVKTQNLPLFLFKSIIFSELKNLVYPLYMIIIIVTLKKTIKMLLKDIPYYLYYLFFFSRQWYCLGSEFWISYNWGLFLEKNREVFDSFVRLIQKSFSHVHVFSKKFEKVPTNQNCMSITTNIY